MKFKIGTIVILEVDEHVELGIVISEEQGKKYCICNDSACENIKNIQYMSVYFFNGYNNCPFVVLSSLEEYHEI